MASKILRLQSSWAVYSVEGNAIELASMALGKRLTLRPALPQLRRALEILRDGVDARHPATALERSSGLPHAQSELLLSHLRERGAMVLRDTSDDVLLMDGFSLYDRQIRFFNFFETPETTGFDYNHRLQTRCVLIPGLGGLGGWIALFCARLGIQRIIGIDPDRVEESNLHRQVLYGRNDIGRLKIEAASEMLTSVDPQIEFIGLPIWIRDAKDLIPHLDGVDLVINPFPWIQTFHEAARSVADAALEAGVPCLNMLAPQVVGPLTVPGETACLKCALKVLNERLEFGKAVQAAVPSSTVRQTFLAALAPRQATLAGIAVWEATRYLTGIEVPRTLEGVIWLDIARYDRYPFIPVPRISSCPACKRAGGTISSPWSRGKA